MAPSSRDECITEVHPFLATTNTTRARVDSSGETTPVPTPTTSPVPWLVVRINSTSFVTYVLIQTTLSQLWLVMLALLLLLFPSLLLLALALTRTLSFLGSRHSVPRRHRLRLHGSPDDELLLVKTRPIQSSLFSQSFFCFFFRGPNFLSF